MPEQDLQDQFGKQVAEIEKILAPDKRVNTLTVRLTLEDGKWLVEGETTVPAAGEAIRTVARDVFKKALGDVRLVVLPSLPDARTEALVRVSVAPLRKEPRHAAEMVDQALMGMSLQVLKVQGNWVFVRTPYQYLGWTESLAVKRLGPKRAAHWRRGPLARFSAPVGIIWADLAQTRVLSDIVLGCVVRTTGSDGPCTEVELPDGRTGFVPRSLLRPADGGAKTAPSRDEIVNLALRLMGVPYLWGGNSTKGFDCSGFTQTVFKMQDVMLPRDADQQAVMGREVPLDPDFGNILPGDLLFFGKDRITHVAISLGGPHFIQASGDVNIKSLANLDRDYDRGRRETLKQVRRIIEP